MVPLNPSFHQLFLQSLCQRQILLSSLRSLHLMHECCLHCGYLARVQKTVLEEKLSENISALLIAGDFCLGTIFCGCLFPRTDLIHPLY